MIRESNIDRLRSTRFDGTVPHHWRVPILSSVSRNYTTTSFPNVDDRQYYWEYQLVSTEADRSNNITVIVHNNAIFVINHRLLKRQPLRNPNLSGDSQQLCFAKSSQFGISIWAQPYKMGDTRKMRQIAL